MDLSTQNHNYLGTPQATDESIGPNPQSTIRHEKGRTGWQHVELTIQNDLVEDWSKVIMQCATAYGFGLPRPLHRHITHENFQYLHTCRFKRMVELKRVHGNISFHCLFLKYCPNHNTRG